jgi:hypothetical protein
MVYVIAILAVVGGALAFKAKKELQKYYRTGSNGICTEPFQTP